MSSVVVFWIVVVIMAIGALGTFLPILPGTPIIFLCALGYGVYEGFQQVTPMLLIILFILMLFTFAVDYFAGVVGAKKYGGTKYGSWGAFIGGIIGVIVFNIPGLIIGPFAGAVIGEIINGRKPDEALKVGFGTVIGMAGGAFVKFIVALGMVLLFIITVL